MQRAQRNHAAWRSGAKIAIRAAAWAALVASLACSGPATKPKASVEADPPRPGSLNPIQEERSESAVIERLDLNGDQRPDVFKHYALVDDPAGDGKGGRLQRKVLIRKEIDVNFDRRIDIVEFYTGGSGKEVKEREEFDLDLDGRVDEIRKYKDGHLIETDLDQGGNGKIDTWMFYQLTKNEDGKDVNRLVERRRDHNGDGLVDVWEYYAKGALQKIGRDANGDGHPDQYTRVDDKQK